MFSFIRSKIVSRAFRRNRRKRCFHNIQTIEKILIVFQIKDLKEIQLIANDLKKVGKSVLLWTVKDNDTIVIDSSFVYQGLRILEDKDLSNIVILKPKIKKEFESLEYDTLIDFTRNRDKYIECLSYLVGLNTAEFCIGCRNNMPEGVYDFTVIGKKGYNTPDLYEQIKLYLQNIKSQEIK